MQRTEFELLQESYEDIKVKNYIDGLYQEGYTQLEITNLLNEAGILSRGLAHLKGLFNKDSLKNAGNYVAGKAAGALGQKASNLAQKGAGVLQKGLEKGGKALGISNRAIKSSGAYKGLKQAGQKVQDFADQTVDKGNAAESNVRGQKLASLVDSHTQDISNLFNNIVKQKTELVTGINTLISQIIEDYQKIGGLKDSRVSNSLLPQLEEEIVNKFLSRPLSALTDPKQLSIEFRKVVIDYINTEKRSLGGGGNPGYGLRSADKLK